MSVRPSNERITFKNVDDILKVDFMIAQIGLAFPWIPSEIKNVCEQPLLSFDHNKIAPDRYFSINRAAVVKLGRHDPDADLYIQSYEVLQTL